MASHALLRLMFRTWRDQCLLHAAFTQLRREAVGWRLMTDRSRNWHATWNFYGLDAIVDANDNPVDLDAEIDRILGPWRYPSSWYPPRF